MNRFLFALVGAAGVVLSPVRADDTREMSELKSEVESLRRDVASLQANARTVSPGARNPSISAALDVVGSYSDAADNFNLIARDVEVMISANADPFVSGYMVLNAATELDPTEKSETFEETSLGVEEAALQTTALPGGLALKGGVFFADFTRLAKVHPHDRPFTDGPNSVDGIIGGEAKAAGAELNWVPPLPHYLRITFGAVDEIGAEPAVNASLDRLDGEEGEAFAGEDHRSFDSLMYYTRAATVLELGEKSILNIGANYGLGGDEAERELASADFRFEHRPGGHDLLEIGGEWLDSSIDGNLGEDSIFDGGPTTGEAAADGGYLYIQYRFGKRWQPGLRFDILNPETFAQVDADADGAADGIELGDDSTQSASAYLSYYPSETSRVRLQINRVTSDGEIAGGKDEDTQVFIQWSAILGAHKHDFIP